MPLPAFDPLRHRIEYGATLDDLGPRIPPGSEPGIEEAAGGQAVGRLDVHDHWPDGLAPAPFALEPDPSPFDALPKADYLVVTWTVAELEALADVLTPGVKRNAWYRYARGFEKHYLPLIRDGAPSKKAKRLGSYYMTKIGAATVVLFKSELHLNQDGIMQPEGYATLPVKDLMVQLMKEVQPKLVITVGTAGASNPEHWLGDVYVTRAARFRCNSEFGKAPYNNTTYTSDFPIPTARLADANQLLKLQEPNLVEPDFCPPTGHYPWPGDNIPGTKNKPRIRLDGGGGEDDFEAFHPMLSTDFFEFGTTQNGLWKHGCALEMGDAALGLAAQEMGADAPRWIVIRNASDPAINGKLPRGARAVDMQAHWAVWYYEAYGYWTSVNSAIATWGIIASDLEQAS